MPIESYSYQRGSFLKLTVIVRLGNRTRQMPNAHLALIHRPGEIKLPDY